MKRPKPAASPIAACALDQEPPKLAYTARMHQAAESSTAPAVSASVFGARYLRDHARE